MARPMIEGGKPTPVWLRIAALGWGMIMLFWLPVEDLDIRVPVFFSTGIASLISARLLFSETAISRMIPVGVLCGLAVIPLAVSIVVLKGGLHGHGTLDFNNLDLIDLLWRTPIWGLVGGFFGLGLWFWKRAQDSLTLGHQA